MAGSAQGILLVVLVALAGVLLAAWWRSFHVYHQFEWRHRRGLVCLTLALGQVRVYASVLPGGTRNDRGFTHRVERRWPMFDPQRSPNDAVYRAWVGFTYARGERAETRTRYRVAAVPLWFLSGAVLSVATVLAVVTTRS